jgi:hypothetical protein
MRAALNYLISALIRSTGNEEDGVSEFPIYGIDGKVAWSEIDAWWETDRGGRIRKKLRNTPPGTKAALKALQPFHGVPRTDPHRHPLFALQALSNRDKHRRLNLLARGAAIDFRDARGNPLFDGPPVTTRVPGTDERDEQMVTLTVRYERDMDLYLLPTYDIRLHEPPELFGGLVDTLAGINAYVDGRVLPTVTRLLRA